MLMHPYYQYPAIYAHVILFFSKTHVIVCLSLVNNVSRPVHLLILPIYRLDYEYPSIINKKTPYILCINTEIQASSCSDSKSLDQFRMIFRNLSIHILFIYLHAGNHSIFHGVIFCYVN